MEDFYSAAVEDAVEAARRQEPAIRQVQLVEAALRDIESAAENIRVMHVRVTRFAGETAQAADAIRPLVQSVNLGVARITASWQPIFDAAQLNLVKKVSLDVSAALKPMLDQWHAAMANDAFRLVKTVDWPSLTGQRLATVAAAMQVLTARHAAGVGVAALPKPSIFGVGEVALPGGSDAWPAIAEQLQRIGALSCGEIYAIVLVLVAFILVPKLRDDIGDAVLFIGIANWIIRNGRR